MNNTKKQYVGLIPVYLSVFMFGYWLIAQLSGMKENAGELFSDSYWIIPLLAAIFGIYYARHWGSFKSVFGRSLLFMSLGLLFESLGLLVYTITYRITGNELPYPSFGDAIFLLGIASYSIGAWNLLRIFAPSKRLVIKPLWQIILTILSMSGVLLLVWFGFLNVGIIDDRGLITQLLNVAYPVLQLGFLASTLLALFKAKSVKGGIMSSAVITTLVSLALLYIADYVFLYESYKETWTAGGVSDLLYVLAYGALSLSVFSINYSRKKLLNSRVQ